MEIDSQRDGRGYALALTVLVFLAVFASSLIKIGDYDIWYHLRAGEHILHTGVINHSEPFSFVAHDRPWSVQSWLAGVVFYGVYGLSGINGLIVFNALLITAAFFIVFLTLRLSSDGEKDIPSYWLLFVLLSAVTARFRFFVRPHIFEFLFLASSMFILESWRLRGRNYLYLLPVIHILWVNIHGSFITNMAVQGIYIIGALARKGENAPGPSRGRSVKYLSFTLAATLAATLINPVTYKAFTLPFLITGQQTYMANIGEWQPLKLFHLWGMNLRYTWGFVLLALLAVTGFLLRPKKLELTDCLLFLFFFAMAIKGIRLIAEFAIVVAPIAARSVYPLLSRPFLGRNTGKVLVACAAGLLVLKNLLLGGAFEMGFGVKNRIFPERAIEFVQKNGIKGRVFNSFGFGDYMVWKAFPEREVFIHGRNDVIPEGVYEQYLKAKESPAVWKELTEKYGITYAMLDYYKTDYTGKDVFAHLMHNPEWVPVYWDSTSVVYLKRCPENDGKIERLGFRLIRPSSLDFSYLEEHIKNGLAQDVYEELARLLAISPENEEAYLARAFLSFQLSANYDLAIGDLKKALELEPERPMSYSALGLVYARMKDYVDARAAYEKALKLDPKDPAALYGMERLKEAGI